MHATATTKGRTASDDATERRVIAEGLLALLRHLFTYDRGGGFLQTIEESGLTLVQVKALLALEAHGGEPLPIRDLAEELGITPPAATRAVDALVERKLITRSEDPDDRRVRRIAITGPGRAIVEELASRRVAGLERFADDLSAAQRRKLIGALDALLEDPSFASTYEAANHPRARP